MKCELTGKGKTDNDTIRYPDYWDMLSNCLHDKIGMSSAHVAASTSQLESVVDKTIGKSNAFSAQKERVAWNPSPKKKSDVEKMQQSLEKLVNHITKTDDNNIVSSTNQEMQDIKSEVVALREDINELKVLIRSHFV